MHSPFLFAYLLALNLYISYCSLYYGMHMKKMYSFRLESTLINEFDKLDGSRTSNIQKAIESYCLPQRDYSNTMYLQHLEQEVAYLRDIHSKVMGRIVLLPEHTTEPKIVDIATTPINKPIKRSIWSRLHFS
jgi:hypothetical protein